MAIKRGNDKKIKREEGDLANLLAVLPANPIEWTAVLRVIAPIVARLAVRYALKRLQRDLGEDKVNAIGKSVADFIGVIIERRTGGLGDVVGSKTTK